MAAANSQKASIKIKLDSTSSMTTTEKSGGDNEKDKENICAENEATPIGYHCEGNGVEMDGMIFDFPALRTVCLFMDQQNQLPTRPWHHYRPNLSINLTVCFFNNEQGLFGLLEGLVVGLGFGGKWASARYSSIKEISYILNVQNPSIHMVNNLTVAVAFQALPFFDYTVIREDYRPHEHVIARAYFDQIYSGSTSIAVLDMKKPFFPPFLVTFSTTSGIPPPSTPQNIMKQYMEKVIHEVATKGISFMKLMKLQHSCIITHLDALITYEVYKRIRIVDGHEIPTMLLKDDKNEDVSATALIPINAAKVIWGAQFNLPKIYETFVPSVSPRGTPVKGFILVKNVFVEIKFSIQVDTTNVNIHFTTPLRTITLYMKKEIQIKFNSLCLLGNHVKQCTAPPLNYMEEKEMIENGNYHLEDYSLLNNMKLLNLLEEQLEKKVEDQKK